MLGFIKKDLAMIKSNFKLLAILFVVYAIMGFMGKMDISSLLPFMSVMIMISTFSYDELNKWDSYSSTFPDGRRNSVKAKYFATLLFILIVVCITIILSLIINFNDLKTFDYKEFFLTILGTVFGTLLVLSFMYPIIYKFGIEKARIFIFVIVFGIVVIGGILINYIDLSKFLMMFAFLENYWIIVIILLSIILVYRSYRLSLRIHLKKEF